VIAAPEGEERATIGPMIDCPTRCFILTGPIGSGKTSALRAAVARLAEAGRGVAAVSQPDLGRGPDRGALGF
jgi:type II secretory ATPase GspE/PulE/Tfp pilus assembly ATPase PilB-like protein